MGGWVERGREGCSHTKVSRDFQTSHTDGLMFFKLILDHEFIVQATTEIAKHGVRIRRRNMNIHRDQRIIKQFNWFLGECLFTFPYSPEINFTSGKRSTQWVKRLLEVVSPLNSQATRLTDYLRVCTTKMA